MREVEHFSPVELATHPAYYYSVLKEIQFGSSGILLDRGLLLSILYKTYNEWVGHVGGINLDLHIVRSIWVYGKCFVYESAPHTALIAITAVYDTAIFSRAGWIQRKAK